MYYKMITGIIESSIKFEKAKEGLLIDKHKGERFKKDRKLIWYLNIN